MRLTAGDLTIQDITYSSTSDSRQLTISTGTSTSKTLTLNGSVSNPLIAQTGGSGTVFTIHPNSSTGSGALILQLNASGEFNVQNSGATLSISSAISETGGSRSITKTGAGTLILSGANTYTGGTTLGTGTPNTGGAITLGASGALGSGGFTFAGGILNANNNSVSIGALSLTANSTLNLESDSTAAALTFASVASVTGGTTLTIFGWDSSNTRDQIIMTANPTSSGILSQIQFSGYALGANWNSGTREITPVPEPINVALGVFGVVFAGIGLARRIRARAPETN